MTRTISRLEKTHRRLQGQILSLAYAFDVIAHLPGVVAELGLGHGRTFDHLRRHLPGREIYVFDHADNAYADCKPDAAYFIAGDVADTYPIFAQQHAGFIGYGAQALGYRRVDLQARAKLVEQCAAVRHHVEQGGHGQ